MTSASNRDFFNFDLNESQRSGLKGDETQVTVHTRRDSKLVPPHITDVSDRNNLANATSDILNESNSSSVYQTDISISSDHISPTTTSATENSLNVSNNDNARSTLG